MIKITNDMAEVISAKDAVVYFSAEWCGPCKQLKPQMAKAAMQDESRDYFFVDVDKVDPDYLKQYSIQSIPQVYKINEGILGTKITAKNSDEIIEQVNG
jgi:thioredoxin 1